MKFLMTYTGDPSNPPPTPETFEALGKYTVEKIQSGTVVMTGGIVRPTKGTKVRFAGGKFSVTDGPFPETKELIDGFAIVQAKSVEAAIEEAETFMKVAGDGVGEILRIYDQGDESHH